LYPRQQQGGKIFLLSLQSVKKFSYKNGKGLFWVSLAIDFIATMTGDLEYLLRYH